MLQVRFTIFNMLLMTGAIGLVYFYVSSLADTMGASVRYKIPYVFLLVSIVLSYLAIRSIRKDEAMIRAADRIR